jgi:hypothetical protein
MFNRRSFLQSTLAAGLGSPALAATWPGARQSTDPNGAREGNAPAGCERSLARSLVFDILGHPPTWTLANAGLHPVSPERVVVMTKRDCDGFNTLNRDESARLLPWVKSIAMNTRYVERGGTLHRCWRWGVSDEKLDAILRMMDIMTTHYKVPHMFEKWAIGAAQREALASTGFGAGGALLHQFQPKQPLCVANPPIDWWLFLFPDGLDWDSFDDRPVYMMVAHAVAYDSEVHGFLIPAYVVAHGATCELLNGRNDELWLKLLAMQDPPEAAFTFNMAVARAFKRLIGHK